MERFKKRSLGTKITLTMMSVLAMMVLFMSGVLFMSMADISTTLSSANKEMGETSGEASLSSMTALMQERLLELAGDKADLADAMFRDFEQSVCVAAAAAEQIYADPEAYSERAVPVPAAENDGELAIQILYAEDTDPEDERIVREAGLLSNVQDTLLAVNHNSPNMASNYVATESGFMIQADYISASKFDAEGRILPLNARERPWYTGAKESGAPFFTPVTRDYHTTRLGIMCGVPVYRDGELMAVAGAGMYLDDIESMVHSIQLGEDGNACILNRFGRVLISTNEEGVFAVSDEGEDLRESRDEALAALAAKAVSRENGVELLEIDGKMRYVAYAPMKTVGWSFLVLLPQEEVEAPTRELQASLGAIADQASRDVRKQIRNSAILLAAVLAVALAVVQVIAVALSRRVVRPIQMLTDEVRQLEGDDLDFACELDTGDETQILAESFQSLTGRMKTYIRDVQEITAENERISTELGLASRIQADMLPNMFPPFPERQEFDLYAVMDPAKEVGGDFYNFFMIDEDHLCLMMADVSGKGVPAALFMMASMIILANNASMGQSPAKVLENTNQAICTNNREEMFVTVWIGILEISTGKLTAANAGHEYPALKKADGPFELVRDKHGFVIGAMPTARFHEYELQLEPGSRLFLYTDGVPEATAADKTLFGTERMVDALNTDPELSARELLGNVQKAVDAFVGDAPQFDDLTMMCLEYRGAQEKKE